MREVGICKAERCVNITIEDCSSYLWKTLIVRDGLATMGVKTDVVCSQRRGLPQKPGSRLSVVEECLSMQ